MLLIVVRVKGLCVTQLARVPVEVLKDNVRLGKCDPSLFANPLRIVEHVVDLHDAIAGAFQLIPRDVGAKVARPKNVDFARAVFEFAVGLAVAFVAGPVVV